MQNIDGIGDTIVESLLSWKKDKILQQELKNILLYVKPFYIDSRQYRTV